ncbi:hypothetical protein LJ707_15500 [Mucilaginibacter sp. UR6-1]|uniref:hypothetical protein n=1 Tax=Mucilaginibacter sp. UR6-1 TaxID=1435643 RepID=UPI001E55F7B3|nr:hypothetical protein [Mucilaginibacter sp. UR6-1]MCC8410346.1 hypothetical protein [Mucilaginibacter sp. UR6-1]
MKYAIFFISIIFLIGTIIKITNLELGDNYEKLTNYGYGYIAGNALLILFFATLTYFSGRNIIRANFSDIEV